MKYPTLPAKKTREWRVEALSGGCNRRDGVRCAADHQLVEAENLWWKDGALRTRPGLRVDEQQQLKDYFSDISWKFLSEDTVCGQDAVRGRRFLRRVYSHLTETVSLQIGVLTYDGKFVWEGELTDLPAQVTGMVMEYPYTAEEKVLLFLSGGEIYAQNSETFELRDISDDAYVPCIMIGGEGVPNMGDLPSTAGIPYEGRNMLTGRFSAKYTTELNRCVYYFPLKELDDTQTVEAVINYYDGTSVHHTVPAGATEGEYEINDLKLVVNRQKGMFYFINKAAGLTGPLSGGPNNMTVYATKNWSDAEKRRIASMQFCTWFGGSQAGSGSRQFISGNPEEPNRLYWSGQGQPLYFPETNYIAVGDINQSITAFSKQDGWLVIFKEREMYGLSGPDGTVSEHLVDGQLVQNVTATSDYFPLTLLHPQIGCRAPHTISLCGSRLVWADGDGGVYTLIDAGNYSGRRVRELSSLLGTELQGYSREQWENASAAVLSGHYLLLVGNTVYALRIDEKAFNRYESVYDDSAAQQQLAWFIWTVPKSLSYPFFFGNGQQAVALGIYHESGWDRGAPLSLQDGAPDSIPLILGEWGTTPIISRFRTKEYELTGGQANKRILRVRLGMIAEPETEVRFSYLYNGRAVDDAAVLRQGGVDGEFTLTPNCTRARRFGCAVEATGTLAVEGLSWTFRS